MINGMINVRRIIRMVNDMLNRTDMSNADEPSMKLAFERWHGLEVSEDMDIQTEVAWVDYRQAWEASASHARERLAKWMMSNGFATGHGDTMEDLLNSLSDEIQDMRDSQNTHVSDA